MYLTPIPISVGALHSVSTPKSINNKELSQVQRIKTINDIHKSMVDKQRDYKDNLQRGYDLLSPSSRELSVLKSIDEKLGPSIANDFGLSGDEKDARTIAVKIDKASKAITDAWNNALPGFRNGLNEIVEYVRHMDIAARRANFPQEIRRALEQIVHEPIRIIRDARRFSNDLERIIPNIQRRNSVREIAPEDRLPVDRLGIARNFDDFPGNPYDEILNFNQRRGRDDHPTNIVGQPEYLINYAGELEEVNERRQNEILAELANTLNDIVAQVDINIEEVISHVQSEIDDDDDDDYGGDYYPINNELDTDDEYSENDIIGGEFPTTTGRSSRFRSSTTRKPRRKAKDIPTTTDQSSRFSSSTTPKPHRESMVIPTTETGESEMSSRVREKPEEELKPIHHLTANMLYRISSQIKHFISSKEYASIPDDEYPTGNSIHKMISDYNTRMSEDREPELPSFVSDYLAQSKPSQIKDDMKLLSYQSISFINNITRRSVNHTLDQYFRSLNRESTPVRGELEALIKSMHAEALKGKLGSGLDSVSDEPLGVTPQKSPLNNLISNGEIPRLPLNEMGELLKSALIAWYSGNHSKTLAQQMLQLTKSLYTAGHIGESVVELVRKITLNR